MARWLVIGCGYVGTALARALVSRGDDVVISRRDAVAAEALAVALGVQGVALDLALPVVALIAASSAASVVVCCAPPGADPTRETQHLVALAADARLVYVSSTGVYGPGAGAWVDEDAPLAPLTASGRARVLAEAALAGHANAIALRVAGIYGPGRSTLDRLRAGTYRIIGDGRSHVSRIHVDDLVAAILAAGASSITTPINIADDDPGEIGEVADALADAHDLPRPPRVSPESVSSEIAHMLTADRRISNARMKRDLGVTLRHPSWRSLLP